MAVSLASETRKLTPKEIASYIRLYRDEYAWTQLNLAHEAHVEERTIQRAESGKHKVSDDTLRKIARALKLSDVDFLNKTHFFKSPGQLEREAEEMKKKYSSVPLTQVTTAKELSDSFIGTGLANFEITEGVSDEQAELIASFFDLLKDYGDIWGDLSFTERLDAERGLTQFIEQLDSEGLCVCVGERRVALRFPGMQDRTKSIPTNQWYVLISSKEFPKKFALVPRRGPIEFG